MDPHPLDLSLLPPISAILLYALDCFLWAFVCEKKG